MRYDPIASAARRKKRIAKRRLLNAGKPKLPARSKLVKALDRVFSLLIRSRDRKETGGKCVFGCGREIEHCFHFVTRSKHSVRWHFLNAAGSCSACNYQNEFNPHPFISWYIKKYGLEAYDSLLAKSNKIAAYSRTDLAAKLSGLETLALEENLIDKRTPGV